jgi:hypothetical protein
MPVGGRRAVQDEVRASVVAKKRGNSRGVKGTQEGGKMRTRNTEDEPARVSVRASQWWKQPSAIDLVETERLNASLGTALTALPLERVPLTGKPDAGDPPVRFGRRGSGNPAIPTLSRDVFVKILCVCSVRVPICGRLAALGFVEFIGQCFAELREHE